MAREGAYYVMDPWVGELRRRGLLKPWARNPVRSLLTPRGWAYYRAIAPLIRSEDLVVKHMVRVNARRARKMLDKTQAEMARIMGCHLLTWGRWERKGEMPPLAEEKLRSLLVEAFPQLRGAA